MKEKLQVEMLKLVLAKRSAIKLDITVLESIDSTNSWCLQQSKAGKSLPFACFAEQQTQGRGRRGKTWFMSPGSNIAMTVTWPFDAAYQQLILLPLSIALAIVETLESFGLRDVQIKWPNDVYVGDKKIAGILIETLPVKSASKKNTEIAVAVGIGLNYDMSSLDENIRQSLTLTDICEQLGLQSLEVFPDRVEVAAALLSNTVIACRDYLQASQRSLEKFRTQYDYCKGKNVEIVLDNNECLSGSAQGVNAAAELLVLIDGQQRAFNSAEVSVKI